jgi:predicted NAD/FAD-dependent oxidoreductase
MDTRVAIIGAGMAGAAAASSLMAAGLRVTMFDKSRGVGGRMSTRRMSTPHSGDLRFDHGAQYFTVRGDAFRRALSPLRADGVVAAWAGAREDGRRDEALVAAPHMPDAVRALTKGCDLALNATVKALTRTEDGWIVSCDGDAQYADIAYDAVLVTTPAPQALPLLASAGVAFDGPDRAVYAPCWALMLAFDAPLKAAAETLRPQRSPIAWIARNSGKPGRPAGADCWVAHAGPEWSRANLELTADAAAQALLAEARSLLGFSAAPAVAVAHRWRYALVETAAGADCFWDERARIGAAGDWCIGPRVEAAFDSGDALARRLLRSHDL